jgi:hypothetical protein
MDAVVGVSGWGQTRRDNSIRTNPDSTEVRVTSALRTPTEGVGN